MTTLTKYPIRTPYLTNRQIIAKAGVMIHPAEGEIKRKLNSISFTADFEEDKQTLDAISCVSNLIAFKCTLRKDGNIISVGRGMSVLNRMNKMVDRTVHNAYASSLVDAIVRSTKVLDSLTSDGPTATAPTVIEPITEKQQNYLKQLIQINVQDDSIRQQRILQLPDLSREEASSMIQEFQR